MWCYVNSNGSGTVVCQDDELLLELVIDAEGSVQAFPWYGNLDEFVKVAIEDLPEYGVFFDNQ